MDANTIKTVQSLGFDVYMRSPDDTWLYFTDGVHLGYLQEDSYGGRSLSTVHKPNRTTGTGYGLDTVTTLDKETLERAFDFAPSWASYGDRRSVVKYRDMAEFIAANSFNQGYKKVEK